MSDGLLRLTVNCPAIPLPSAVSVLATIVTSAASSLLIVPFALAVVIVALLEGLEIVSATVSSASTVKSPFTVTETVVLVSPAVMVPLPVKAT